MVFKKNMMLKNFLLLNFLFLFYGCTYQYNNKNNIDIEKIKKIYLNVESFVINKNNSDSTKTDNLLHNEINNKVFNKLETWAWKKFTIKGKQNVANLNVLKIETNLIDKSKNKKSIISIIRQGKEIYNISLNFDLSIADKKTRVRSMADNSRRDENPYALTTPIYEVFPGEKTIDDPRFAIEMSVMRGLNENILQIFSDYEFFNDNMGSTNLLFADRYPGLTQVRKLYFENVLDSLDLGRYRELFKWIDSSFTDLIGNLLPHTTKFMGINFIYENHVLERNRFKYLFDEIYLKSKPITSDRNLLLSQFVALIERM